MSRIAPRFAQLKQSGRKALIPYITAGDPDPAVTVPMLHARVESGADVIELGVPFSDPMADGPVIQRACERALKKKVGLRRVLEMVRQFREGDRETPLVLMGYLNPIEAMGNRAFITAAVDAGVDGVLTVDLPPEEAHDFSAALVSAGLDPIFLISPTTTAERIRAVAAQARGYLYYVSLKGVTGAATLDVAALDHRLQTIRRYTELPIGVGFGIKDAKTAANVARVADGVVVGSALVSRMAELANDPAAMAREVGDLAAGMRRAMDELGL